MQLEFESNPYQMRGQYKRTHTSEGELLGLWVGDSLGLDEVIGDALGEREGDLDGLLEDNGELLGL